MAIVYILRSAKETSRYYVGQTDDLKRRIEEHNSAQSGHTLKFRPWKLLLSVHFEDPHKADAFEHYLKSGSGRAFAKKHF